MSWLCMNTQGAVVAAMPRFTAPANPELNPASMIRTVTLEDGDDR